MAATKEIALLDLPETNPALVINDADRFTEFYKATRAHVMAHVPDVSTKKGRDEVISLAFKVTKSKTALEAAAKRLKDDAQKQVDQVNASIRRIRTELDDLASEVRLPVTNWEAQEAQRVQIVAATLSSLRNAGVILSSETSEDISRRLEAFKAILIEEIVFQDKYDEAKALLLSAHDALTEGRDRLVKDEADRAELQRLRAEAAERDRVENERLSKERQAKLDAQRVKDEAEAKKKREAQAKADEERRQKELKAAREQAAKDALARAEDAARQEAAGRQREADARAADAANRKRVLGEIEAAIESVMSGVKVTPKIAAQLITAALAAGDIPHTKVTF